MGFDVFGEIISRIPVVVATAAFDDFVQRAFGRNRSTLEHHVLEQVRKTGAAVRLETKADSIRHTNSERRRRVVFGDDHGQAVREFGNRGGNAILLRGRSEVENNAAEQKRGKACVLHWDP